MFKQALLFLFLLPTCFCQAQQVFMTDINNFWSARDSVLSTNQSAKQTGYVTQLYLSKASPGLQAFMRGKDGLAEKWVALITDESVPWESLKSKKPLLDSALISIEHQIANFRKVYPELKPAQTYLIVGLGKQGGTIRGNISILCIEVILRSNDAEKDQLVFMAMHEYVHTQQQRADFQKINVLTSSIREGACDFIAELVTGIPLKHSYLQYGLANEQRVWEAFERDMFTQKRDDWVSTGNNPKLMAPDLGYFVGYQICKAYYDKMADKKQAVKDIIELDFSDDEKVKLFWHRSRYKGGK